MSNHKVSKPQSKPPAGEQRGIITDVVVPIAVAGTGGASANAYVSHLLGGSGSGANDKPKS